MESDSEEEVEAELGMEVEKESNAILTDSNNKVENEAELETEVKRESQTGQLASGPEDHASQATPSSGTASSR